MRAITEEQIGQLDVQVLQRNIPDGALREIATDITVPFFFWRFRLYRHPAVLHALKV
jgi:hypothetical protein